MKKFLRYAWRIAAGILLFLLLIYVSAWVYISYNKTSILQKVKNELNSRINGEITIGNIDATFFQTFPRISIGLYNITVRDSLWNNHHHDLLHAERVFAKLNIFKLFTGNLSVDKIVIEKGSAYLFTDSAGYTNTAILRASQSSEKSKTGKTSTIPSIEIKNSTLFVEKLNRNKFFSFDISRLTAIAKEDEPGRPILLDVSLSILVHNMSFNKKNGSFLEEKKVAGKFKLQFSPEAKILQFQHIRLDIDRHPFIFTGKFFLAEVPVPFTLNIQTENIEYKQAISLLTQNVGKKLSQYDISGNINSINVTLDGTDPENRIPLIKLKVNVNHNDITTPVASFKNSSFTGSFTNEPKRGQDRNDENSILLFKSFSGTWQDIPLQSDSIIISNLVHPVIASDLHADFNLTAINNLTDDKTLKFTKGKGKLDIVYKGAIEDGDSTERIINGTMALDSASIIYEPRNFMLTDCNGKIRLKDKDMYIDQLNARAGSTGLNMSGGIKNLFSLISKNDQKITLNWIINSSKLNLNDFTAFLKKRTTTTITKKKTKVLFVKTLSSILDVLDDCDVHLQLKAKQLLYKKFFATNIAATAMLTNDKVSIKDVVLSHAGGLLTLNGQLLNDISNNSIDLQAHMTNMDINKVLSSFDNFGQNAITDKNLNGKLDATINMSAIITDKAEVVTNSLKGNIDFNIKDGELIDFDPVQKISQTVFKKRDFSDIHFAELKDKFDVDGTKIKVNRMEIHSTVLNMFVEGLYDIKHGTDMSIQIPLSNLKGSNTDSVLLNKGIDSKTGVSVRLRAKTGDDGKLKISWDPFKKALKEKKKR